MYQTDSPTESLSSRNSTRRIKQKRSSNTSVHQLPQESGKLRRLEADEEQVYVTVNMRIQLSSECAK